MKKLIGSNKKLLTGSGEVVIGFGFATVVFINWKSISEFPAVINITEFLQANFNSTIVPHFSMFTTTWIVLIALLVILICVVLIHNFRKHLISKKLKQRQTKYQNFFANVVEDTSQNISKQYTTHEDQSLKQHLSKDDFVKDDNRNALLTELKAMYNIISGDEKGNLRELYFALGFVDDLKNKFEHKSWHKRVEAIHEARQFGVSQLYPKIISLVTDPNEMVRRNALLARVDLDEQPLSFLSDIDYELCNWERHKILTSLAKLPSHKLPRFSDLFTTYPLNRQFLKELSDHFDQSNHASIIQMA